MDPWSLMMRWDRREAQMSSGMIPTLRWHQIIIELMISVFENFSAIKKYLCWTCHTWVLWVYMGSVKRQPIWSCIKMRKFNLSWKDWSVSSILFCYKCYMSKNQNIYFYTPAAWHIVVAHLREDSLPNGIEFNNLGSLLWAKGRSCRFIGNMLFTVWSSLSSKVMSMKLDQKHL